jgi:hypothetical protein
LVGIRIRESVTNGSGSCCFLHRHSRRQPKTTFSKFFCLFLFEGKFTSFFKNKKSSRSHKTVDIKVLLLFLLNDRRGGIRIPDPDL